MKSLLVAIALLALPAFGGLGPSFEVPVTAPTIARAPGTQQQPLVATDGRDFFAVWIDGRGGSSAVLGTRILADGTVLDPTGIVIGSPGANCGSPGLVWDGSNYVVVWQEGYSNSFSTRATFARVDRSGTVLGGPKTLIENASGTPLIASNGRGSMVIFSNRGSVVRIDQNGSVTQRSSVDTVRDLQIASNGDGYLLSWTGSMTYLLRLDDNGDVVAGSAQQLSNGIYTQLTARIGGPYLLVARKWGPDYFSSCARSIEGRLITSSGVSAPFVIHDPGGADIGDIAVKPDGNGFQVVWLKRLGPYPCGPTLDSDPPSFYGPWPPFGVAQIHVGVDGISGAPVTVAEGSGTDSQPSAAGYGTAQVFVWLDNSGRLAAVVAHPGQPVVPIQIASSAAIQNLSSLAAAESSFMTAWVEQSQVDGSRAIYARRFGTDGRALDAAAITVPADNQSNIYRLTVSSDGAVWLFLWGTPGVARRMAADGTWIDAAPFRIGPTDRSFEYAVATNGNGFAVITFAVGPETALTFIPRSGEVRQVPVAVSGLARYVTRASMAWDGSAYVAVCGDGDGNFIEGIRVDQNGQIVTPLFAINRTTRLDSLPSIACHEGTCAVAWQSNDSIAAASIIGGTVVPISTRIAAAAPNTYTETPTVLAVPDGFRLFWRELGGPTPSLITATLTAAGIGSPTLVGPASGYGAAAAAMTTNGQMGLTLVRAANDPAFGGVTRAFLRLWLGERRRAVGR